MKFFNTNSIDNQDKVGMVKQSEGLFNEWFLYDFIMSSGQTVLENFIADNPLGLKDAEMEIYRKLLNNKYGLFETINIEIGKSIALKDLQTGKRWDVRENKATFDLKKGDLFFARIGEVEDHYELIGSDTFIMRDIDGNIEKSLRNEKIKFTPKIVNEIYHNSGKLK